MKESSDSGETKNESTLDKIKRLFSDAGSKIADKVHVKNVKFKFGPFEFEGELGQKQMSACNEFFAEYSTSFIATAILANNVFDSRQKLWELKKAARELDKIDGRKTPEIRLLIMKLLNATCFPVFLQVWGLRLEGNDCSYVDENGEIIPYSEKSNSRFYKDFMIDLEYVQEVFKNFFRSLAKLSGYDDKFLEEYEKIMADAFDKEKNLLPSQKKTHDNQEIGR